MCSGQTAKRPDPTEHALVMIEMFNYDRLAAWMQSLDNRRSQPTPEEKEYWLDVAEAIALAYPQPKVASPQRCQEYYRPDALVTAGS